MGRPTGGYKLDSGKRVPGVTTVLSRWKESGALLWWAFEQGKAAERGEISSLYDKRDEAADVGSVAHEMCDAFLKQTADPYSLLDSLADDAMKAQSIQSYEMFLHWWKQTGLKVHASEIPLVSELHGFGGTPDWILETDNGLAIGDIKTSKAIYRDMLLQVAAYKHLWEENHPDQPITGGFYICRFSKTAADWENRYFSELEEAWELFLLLLKSYELDKTLKKRVG